MFLFKFTIIFAYVRNSPTGNFYCHFKVNDFTQICFVEHYLFYLDLYVLLIINACIINSSLHRILMYYHSKDLFLKKMCYFE